MKFTKLFRYLPFVLTCLIVAALLFLLRLNRTELASNQSYYQLLTRSYEMQDISDYLTSQTQFYVQYGEPIYRTAYFAEYDKFTNRQRIYTAISESGSSLESQMLLVKALDYAYFLREFELRALAAADKGDLESARQMIFSDEYHQLKQPISTTLNAFRTTLAAQHQEELSNVQLKIHITTVFIVLYLAALLVLLGYLQLVLKGKTSLLVHLNQLAGALSHSQFDVLPSPYEDDPTYGTLAAELNTILANAQAGLARVAKTTAQTIIGDFDPIESLDSFEGAWKQALLDMTQSLKNLHDEVITAVPMAYAYVVDGMIADCNAPARTLLAFKLDSALADFFYSEEELDEINSLLAENGVVSGYKARFNMGRSPLNFRRFRVYISSHPTQRSFYLWAEDIEENELKRESIYRRQENISEIINLLPIAVLVIDPITTEIKYVNEAYIRLFECPPHADIIGFSECHLYKQEEVDFTEGKSVEFWYKTHTGKLLETRVTMRNVQYGGVPAQLKIIQDISAEKRLTSLLQDTAVKERDANQLKSQFLVNMSHEVRTTMNSVIGLSYLAATREQNTYNSDAFRKINVSSRRLMTMMSDISDFTKIESNRLELVEAEFNLEDIVSSTFVMVNEQVINKEVEMLFQVQPDVPYLLYGDKTRLWQILKNLLDNAAKYTNAGHVVLRVSVKQPITGMAKLSFELEDTGIGMSEQQLEAIFVPFMQYPADVKYNNLGSCLSMPLTKQLVTLMGGKISAKSTPHVGSVFLVELPFKVADPKATIARLYAQNSMNNCNILIVDDDPISREIMENLLHQMGLTPTCVQTAQEAIELTISRQESGYPFVLLITDYHLDSMNGITLAGRLQEYTPSLKLILISAYLKLFPESELLRLDFYDVLQKPFAPSAFLQAVRDVLRDPLPSSMSYNNLGNARVLLVEDNLISQEVALGMLKILGIHPLVVNNGEDALAALEEHHFHLILMDVQMPVMDGIETTKRIRASNKPYRQIPILAMTANVLAEQLSSYTKIGMNGCLRKPLEFDNIYAEIKRWLPLQICNTTEFPDEIPVSFAIEEVDVAHSLARFGGAEDHYTTALIGFADSLVKLPTFRDIMADFDSGIRVLHTMIGVSGNLGANALSQEIRNCVTSLLEQQLDNDAYNAMRRNALRLSDRIHATFQGTALLDDES